MATTNNDEREHEVEQAIWQFLDAQLRGSDRDIEELVKKYPEFEDRIRQKIAEFQKVDSLFDSLFHADDSDFEMRMFAARYKSIWVHDVYVHHSRLPGEQTSSPWWRHDKAVFKQKWGKV